MSDSIEISRQQLYLLITVSSILAIVFIVFGFVLGQQVKTPFPSEKQIIEEIERREANSSVPTIIHSAPLSKQPASAKPGVPDEQLEFFEKLGDKTPLPTIVVTQQPIPTKTPRPEKKKETPSASEEKTPKWAIQVASYGELKNAEKHRDRLKKSGYPAYLSTQVYQNNKTLHIVRLGPYDTEAEARKKMKDVEKHENKDVLIKKVFSGSY